LEVEFVTIFCWKDTADKSCTIFIETVSKIWK